MSRWQMRPESEWVHRPGDDYITINNSYTFSSLIPWKSEENYALFVCCESQVTTAPYLTKIYLVHRDGFTPVVLQEFDVEELYMDVMELSDGSLLLAGDRRVIDNAVTLSVPFVRRVRRVGEQLVFGPRINIPIPEGDPSSDGVSDWAALCQHNDGFYAFYGMNRYTSGPGWAGWEEVWARRYSYNLSSDTISLSVGLHKAWDRSDWPIENTTYGWHTPPVAIGVQHNQTHLSVPWVYNWRLGSSAHAHDMMARVTLSGGQATVTNLRDVTIRPTSTGGGGTSTVISRGGRGYAAVFLRNISGGVHVRLVTWGYTSTGDYVANIAVGSAPSGEFARPRTCNVGTAFGLRGLGYIAPDGRIRHYEYDRDTGLLINMNNQSKPPLNLSEGIFTWLNLSSSQDGFARSDGRSVYTMCQMTTDRTLVCFQWNSTTDGTWRRYFRVIEGFDLAPWLRIQGRDQTSRVLTSGAIQNSPKVGPGGHW